MELIGRVASLTLTMLVHVGLLVGFQAKGLSEEQSPSTSFSIYCNSNLDGTGRCVRDSDSESITCQIIPGAVISCRDKAKRIYECVQYGSIVANQTQTQFVCKANSRQLINDQLFNNSSPPSPADQNPFPAPDASGASTSSPNTNDAPSPQAVPQPQRPQLIDPFDSSVPATPAPVIPNGF